MEDGQAARKMVQVYKKTHKAPKKERAIGKTTSSKREDNFSLIRRGKTYHRLKPKRAELLR